jgi:hypothetical protein
LLFGAGCQPPMSTRCSPATYNCTSSLYIITSKFSLIPCRDTIQRVGVLPTLCKISLSSTLLRARHSTIWWMNTCPRHGLKTIPRLHSLTMLGACLFQHHDAIYSQSQTSGRWQSNDTVTTWSRGPANMCTIKRDDFTPISRHLCR